LPLKASRKEQPSVIRFLWAKELDTNVIQSETYPVYGDKYFTRPAIHVWCKTFAHGHESVVDEEEPGFDDRCNDRSGRFSQAVKPACDGINVSTTLDNTLNKKLSYR